MNTRLSSIVFMAILSSTVTLDAAQIPLSTTAPFTTLDQLLGDDNFAVFGDLRFDDFTYTWTGQMPTPAGVNVIPIVDTNGRPGLRFQGGFADQAGGDPSDGLISFAATATATASAIGEAHLTGNPDLFGGDVGTGLAGVTETFIPEVTDDSITVYDNGSVEQLTDAIVFNPPLSTVHVQKSILLLSADNSAGAGLAFIDQTFSLVPEPAAGGLAILAGIGTLLARKRRRS